MTAITNMYVAVGAGTNRYGLWTFLVLWIMRQSAKLNLFFGVPNLGEQYLPAHLQEALSYFEASPLMKDTLGEPTFTRFIDNKRLELDRYNRYITDYEIQEYLPIL